MHIKITGFCVLKGSVIVWFNNDFQQTDFIVLVRYIFEQILKILGSFLPEIAVFFTRYDSMNSHKMCFLCINVPSR